MQHALLVVAMITVVGISACDDEEEGPTKTIWQLVQEDTNLQMLEEQLEAAGLDAVLSSTTGTYTLFAPSNAAMTTLLTTLGIDSFDPVSDAVVEQVLKYHILESQKLYAELDGDLVTMQGENITIATTTTGDKILDTGATNDAAITTRDIRGTNGVIHIINTVTVPPSVGELIVKTLGTVAQPLLLLEDFSTLSAGIQMAEVFAATNATNGQPRLLGTIENRGILIAEDIITVFAVSNAVFETAGITPADLTGEQWYGLILNHIAAGDYSEPGDYTVGGKIPTLTGGELTVLSTTADPNPAQGITTGIVLDSNGDTTPEAQIAILDLLGTLGATPANNGYINPIAGVLNPN